MKRWMGAFVMALWVMSCIPLDGTIESAEAALVTQLDFTSGAVNWNGRQGQVLDRLLDQEGTIKMGQYQSWSEIVDPITKGQKSYSLLTSNVQGALAPTATITGNTITVDLSSLYFGWTRGGETRLWNIGGQATGLFNPETSEFFLSWEHILSGNRGHGEGGPGRVATFFLQGTAIPASAAVAIPASIFLYATGLFGAGSWSWWRRRRQAIATS